MDKRLDNLRLYFPAEVTGSYLAIQSLFKANGIRATEEPWLMAGIALALAVVDIFIYWKFYKITSWLLHVVLFCGFIIWVLNIDTARYADVRLPGTLRIEIVAPILLIFYSLLTLFISEPVRAKDAQKR